MDSRLSALARYFLSRGDAAGVLPNAIDPKLLPYVFVLEIEAGPKLRVRLAGTALDIAFHPGLVGRYMEDFIHGPRGEEVLRGFHDCATSHAPVWMRQVVRIKNKAPRFVEGIAVFLAPDRIFGGLLVGETQDGIADTAFLRRPLSVALAGDAVPRNPPSGADPAKT
jgi:hypothetical protein